jgi:hypothetical protein
MRDAIPYMVADVSALSRRLEAELSTLGRVPRHLELLNMLARGAGFGNFQHLRAQAVAAGKLAPVPADPADLQQVVRAANYFDDTGRLLQWPSKESLARLCLWVLWSRVPRGELFTERSFGELLKAWHSFGDHALLRRAMADWRMMHRTVDGREYRRIEQPPPPELKPLLARLAARVVTMPA